jgi:MFS family permease
MPSTPFAVFRNPAFARYWLTRIAYILGWQIQTTALLWLAPQLARAAGQSDRQAIFALGLVGLFQFVPLLLFSLIGGQIADRYDRKTILVVCFAAKLMIALGLCVGAADLPPGVMLHAVYGSAMLSGMVNAFQPAASQAFLPSLVTREELPQAIAASSLAFTFGSIVGPGVGGVLLVWGAVHHQAAPFAFAAAAALLAIGLLALLQVPSPKVARADARPALQLIAEGLRYVRDNKMLLGAISLDLVVVLLASAQALIPIFAERLGVSEAGYGMLRAALPFGAAATALALAFAPLRRNVGRWMFGATFVFAAATVLFGVSTNFWLSCAAMAIAGAADMISVNVRQTLIQIITPEAMLGRVASVSFVFVSASNELGDFEAGAAGAIFGPVAGVVLGGVLAFFAAMLWLVLFRDLAKADTFEGPLASQTQPAPAST